MNVLKIRQFLGVTVLLGLLNPIEASAADPSPSTRSWLFVQDAASGTLVGTDDQNLTLTLKNVRLYTSAFSDRPDRLAAALPNQKFIDNWATGFASSPPNATLSYRHAGSVRPTNIVLTLTSPSYDPKKLTIKYKAATVFRTISNHVPNAPGSCSPYQKVLEQQVSSSIL